MTEQEITEHMKKIDEMSREIMSFIWRFAPAGHPYFIADSPLCDHFLNRFQKLGGFTPQISKLIDDRKIINKRQSK